MCMEIIKLFNLFQSICVCWKILELQQIHTSDDKYCTGFIKKGKVILGLVTTLTILYLKLPLTIHPPHSPSRLQ